MANTHQMDGFDFIWQTRRNAAPYTIIYLACETLV